METVYIIAIITVAVVILGTVWLLRNRITAGRFGASVTEKKVEAEVEAAPPQPASPPSSLPPSPLQKPSSVDISGNVMIGAQVVRIWRNSVRLARNWLWGKQRLEVKKEAPPKSVPPSKKGKTKKRKK